MFTGRCKTNPSPLTDGSEDMADIVGIVCPYECPFLSVIGDSSREEDDAAKNQSSDSIQQYRWQRRSSRLVQPNAYMISMPDELDYNAQELLRELLRDLERSIIHGDGESGESGLVAWLPGMSGENDLFVAIDKSVDLIWRRERSVPNTILFGLDVGRRFRASGARSVYESDRGILRSVLSRWIPANELWLIDTTLINIAPVVGSRFRKSIVNPDVPDLNGQVVRIDGSYVISTLNRGAHSRLVLEK